MLDMGAFNQDGQSLIIMAGQSGDSLAATPLSGSGFAYTEASSSGAQNSGVLLAMNGTTETATLTGLNTVSDVSGFQINLSTGTTARIDGSNNNIQLKTGDAMGAFGGANTINAVAGSVAYASGTNGSYDIINTNGDVFGSTAVNGQGSGIWLDKNVQANVYGNNNGISLNTGDSVGALGGANTINAAVGSVVYVTGTHGSYDTVNANGDVFGSTAANGQGTGVWLDNNVQANVYGNNNGISLNTGDSVGALGGANTINAAVGSVVYVTGTHGSYDTVNANGDAFGSTAANGQGTGVWLDNNVQVNVYGNNNGISLNTGDSMGALGGANTINAAVGSVVYLTGTHGSYDTVNANGDAFGSTAANGQGTGVWLDNNVQVNVYGNNNGISLNTGDSMGALGGANTINAAVGSVVYMTGTHGAYDTVNANGDMFGGTAANGQGTGIWMDANAQANVYGNNNGISVNAGDSMGAFGGANIINAVAGSVTYIVNTNGKADVINASGDLFGATAANGQASGIWLGTNSQAIVNGGANDVDMAAGCTLTATGNSDVVNMVAGSVVNVSGTGDNLNGSNAIVNITGNNQVVYLSGAYNTVTVTGVDVTVYAQNSTVNFVGAAANNNSDAVIGAGNIGTGQTQYDAWQALIGVPHAIGAPPPFQLPSFTDPADPSSFDDSVQVFPVPTPVVPTTEIPGGCPDGIDPIILNLSGNEVQTTTLAGSSTYFDMLNNGQKVQTGWGTAGEGYLVYDPNDSNNTTAITQDSQMVGGFGALQSLAQQVDGSGHGTLTQADTLWHNLKVWVDTTGSGQFQSGQLMSLDQLGITSLNLDGTAVNRNSNGNQILVDSSFTRADGSTGDVAGVNLMFNPNATASPVDNQVRNLIAAMSSFVAPAGSSAVPLPVHQDSFAALAANLH